MLKIRHISSLLVLILLFISCDLKSQVEGIVLKDPDFRRIVTGDGALGKPSKVVTLRGVKDPALTEAEKNLGVKLDELLDTFGVSKEGKGSIFKIKDVVTDDKIGSDKSDRNYKTYTNLDFYNLLNELGADKVKNIIKYDLDIVETQKAALEAINNIQEPKKRQSLQVVYDNKLNDYLLRLKGGFSQDADNVYDWFVGGLHINEFTAIKTEARRIIENGDIYEVLSYKESIVINGVLAIVTDGSIGIGEGYRTYTSSDFNALLNELGYAKVQKIIDFYISVNNGRILYDVIERINDEILKENFRIRYDNKWKEYPLHLKSLFNGSSADAVYANFISSKYIDELSEIETEAKRIIENGDI
ncbi:hypothetical protein BOFE_09420 (plasmid) [Candidatus Borrelia fainii]|uniref:Lipoprotein n=1 Tax=Candidatus Borrelia fainii TaxID=2518322 RepID=A0ABM8DLE9_9SPIR|nr:hypothetical protein [Candidatus Borrelia fainii]BDU63402.1 hypothetical protein BOFE_09420 [Candidatus Borrelia fainii]